MKEIVGVDVKTPFPRMEWQEAMDKYMVPISLILVSMLIHNFGYCVANEHLRSLLILLLMVTMFVQSRSLVMQMFLKDISKYEEYIKRFVQRALYGLK